MPPGNRFSPFAHPRGGLGHRFYVAAMVCVAIAACARPAERPVVTTGPLVTPTEPILSAAEEIVSRTNSERSKLRLPALARNAALMRAAQLHAEQMADVNRLAHELPGARYPTMDARIAAAGYRRSAAGENVADGYPSAAAVVAGWMTSPGHRENIVDKQFTEMGAGVAAAKSGRRYYVQVFARPR